MRPVKGLGLLAALAIALGMVASQPAFGTAASKVEAATTAQTAIARLAYANLNKGPCSSSLGGPYFAPDGAMSCKSGVPVGGWCAIFAGWVWNLSGHVYASDLGHTPTSFDAYGRSHGTMRLASSLIPPLVGDVVIFSPSGSSTFSHVAIVYSVNTTTHIVTTIAGNEGAAPGYVRWRSFNYLTRSSSPYWANEYVSPRTH
jgi:hypothetical protein